MTNVQEYKKKIVNDMTNLMKQYKIVGMVNMEDMPAPQLQSMRSELRGKVELFMTKKRFMKIAIEKVKNEKKNIEELEKYFEGMPALLFTNESPFKLSKILKKSKTKAPAKPGQIAPSDIVVYKGPTPFAPGPIISELSSAGLKVGVENGKVAVKEDTVVVKKGEKIKPKVAEILARLDIKPMDIGLGLVAAYEDGIIYQKDILDVDEEQYQDNINLAAAQAFNLAFNITYVTKDNISLLIGKAFMDSKALGTSQNIIDEGIIDDLLAKAEVSMQSLKNTANIETQVLETKEEPKAEEPKPEVPPAKEEIQKKEENTLEEEKKVIQEVEKQKEEVKPGPKIEETKPEIKKEIPKEEPKQLPVEKQKIEASIEKVKEKKEETTDEKVRQMVEKTKKFVTGTEETAADIIEDVKKEEALEERKEEVKGQKVDEKVPSAYDLKKKREETKDDSKKEKDEQKEVEELTKELLKKGTLRK